MKMSKRILAVVMSLALMFLLTFTVFAAETEYTITAPEGSEHTYQIYQILTGAAHNGNVMTDVAWGANGTNSGTAAAAAAAIAAAAGTDAQKLAIIENYVDLTGTPYKTVANGASVKVAGGYYLIRDTAASLAGKDEAYTTYIVQVSSDFTIVPKSAKPTMDLQILDEIADAEAGNENGWGETADHSVNESYKYKMVATLNEDADFASYEKYTLKFTNTLNENIVFESIENVKINGEDVDAGDYVCSANSGDTGVWTITVDDIKEYAEDLNNAELEVIFNAHMTENAKIGDDDSNTDKAYLEYSNNPNPGCSAELGKTAEDTVWVFTYEMNNKKVDGENNVLDGAEFRLYAGENEIGVIYDSTISAYRPIKSGETATVLTSAADGKFNIKGLDAAVYTLKETKAPADFNACDDVTVTISAVHIESEDEATATTTITTKQGETAADEIVIVNLKGIVLPSTGGTGTTVIYIIGIVMVLFAAVLLIVKRRTAILNK